ncbi:MAG: dihydrodipicolinate synthase family protein, partial [Christensenellales bacterium]
HPVIAGTGCASTYQTIRMSQYAQSLGADGVQIIHPFYFVPTVEGMLQHYQKVAEAIDIGIIVYNNPAFSQSWVNPKLMLRLIERTEGKISGIKENTPHLMLFDAMVQALKGSGVAISSGFGEKWYAYQFPYGSDGMVSPFGNFFPEYPIKLYNAAQRYDFDEIRSLLDMMKPYYDFVGRCSAARGDTGIQAKPGGSIYGEGNLRFGVLKEAMNLMGLRGGYMRLPLVGLEDNERSELKQILKVLKLM